jgi:hypothetical protein
MALFISYSSQDRQTVDALLAALRRGQQQVWFDEELGGGDAWWAKICEQIRSCDVFIVALSNNWLQSKPSQAELRYAQALGRPILPVRIGAVDSMRVNPVATLQIIDYRNPTVDAGIQLVTAVHALQAKPQPLPDPLPEEPPVPFGYITRLGNTLAEKELSPHQQLQLLIELRSGFEEDGDDPSARSDIAQLLRMMRLRHDITYRTRTEIDNVLASIDSPEPGSSAAASAISDAKEQAPTIPARRGTGSQPASRTEPAGAGVATTVGGGAATAGGPNRRLIIIGGAALAVIVAIVVAVVFISQGSGTKKTSAGARTAAPTAPAQPAPGATKPLDSVLLGAPQVSTIMGTPSIEITERTQQIRADVRLSNPECHGIQDAAYTGTGFTGVSGQKLDTRDNAYRIFEAAVSFPTADKAQAVVAAQADKWRACNGLAVTMTGTSAQWTFGNLTGAAPKIAQLRTRRDGSTCQRVLSAVSDVVLDVRACAPRIQDQGGQIAEAMAANVK